MNFSEPQCPHLLSDDNLIYTAGLLGEIYKIQFEKVLRYLTKKEGVEQTQTGKKVLLTPGKKHPLSSREAGLSFWFIFFPPERRSGSPLLLLKIS